MTGGERPPYVGHPISPILGTRREATVPSLEVTQGSRHESQRLRTSALPARPCGPRPHRARHPQRAGGRRRRATRHAVQLGRQRVRRARQREHHAPHHPRRRGRTDRRHRRTRRPRARRRAARGRDRGHLGQQPDGSARHRRERRHPLEPGRRTQPEQRDDGVHRALPLDGAPRRWLRVDLGLQLRRPARRRHPHQPQPAGARLRHQDLSLHRRRPRHELRRCHGRHAVGLGPQRRRPARGRHHDQPVGAGPGRVAHRRRTGRRRAGSRGRRPRRRIGLGLGLERVRAGRRRDPHGPAGPRRGHHGCVDGGGRGAPLVRPADHRTGGVVGPQLPQRARRRHQHPAHPSGDRPRSRERGLDRVRSRPRPGRADGWQRPVVGVQHVRAARRRHHHQPLVGSGGAGGGRRDPGYGRGGVLRGPDLERTARQPGAHRAGDCRL